ncbi:MAG: hypothetical protein AB7E39_07615 [Endomicrobiaceae bacterium]
MKIIKNLAVLLLIYIIFFVVSPLFAVNIGRNVYGVYTETYNGVVYEDSTTGDGVEMWGSSSESDTTKIEGSVSVSVGSSGWVGIHFYSNQDMSSYTGGRLYFSLKVPNAVVLTDSGNKIAIFDSTGEKALGFDSTNIKLINSSGTVVSTGISNDNVWHTYYIDLSSFNLSNYDIVYPFSIGTKQNDNTLFFDNVYWKKNNEGSFDVTIKNVSDNLESSTITWINFGDDNVFGKGWKVAEQYIELDLDLASPTWSVKIYSVGGSSTTTNGLFATTDSSKVLPVCWRINDVILPTEVIESTRTIKKSMTIAESLYKGEDGDKCYLYDGEDQTSDPGSEGFWCWFHLTDVLDTTSGDYAVAWDTRGFHGAENDGAFYGISGEIYPRIYLGANFTSALYGLTYRANIAIELSYE